MDFTQALNEAEAIGISRQQFLRIWECEEKMKYLDDELRQHQMRADVEKNCGDVATATSQIIQDQLQKFSIDQRRVLSNLREELQQQNQALITDISRMLEGFATMVGRVIKGELQTALAGLSLSETESNSSCSSNFSDTREVPQSLRHNNQGSTRVNNKEAENDRETVSSFESLRVEHAIGDLLSEADEETERNKNKGQINQKSTVAKKQCAEAQPINKNSENPTSSYEVSPNVLIFPEDMPVQMLVNDISNVSKSGKIIGSKIYHLQNSPFKVQLLLWFEGDEELKMNVKFWSLSPHPLKSSKRFIISGDIKNKNSSAYSSLFSEVSPPFNLQKPWSQNVDLPLLLKTKRGSYSDINLEALYNRNYVFEEGNSICINWSVLQQEG
ncbi:hypothetical protein EGW08_018616 [Elysia chlorotica]|uniref:Uncharacterized protein n=1 Tax=Elysia chlorotica TaxID=188477 RepID=A0A3S0ZFB5_ELYCH|nr:hypothetical protein EGW08_018616 [Elysia chlorotica]